MSIQALYQKALQLPDAAKIAIGAGFGIGLSSIVMGMMTSSDKVNGLPPAKTLKGFSPSMNKKEAELILNLPINYSKQDVQKHHKHLMALHHPDKGGSPFIATKINESKDFLLTGSTV